MSRIWANYRRHYDEAEGYIDKGQSDEGYIDKGYSEDGYIDEFVPCDAGRAKYEQPVLYNLRENETLIEDPAVAPRHLAESPVWACIV